jgi:hypothetical protein
MLATQLAISAPLRGKRELVASDTGSIDPPFVARFRFCGATESNI